MEELQSRHKKELKELQAKITSKKKNATKKTRKGVNDECERLEVDLRERQQAELEALAPSNLENGVSKLQIVDNDVNEAQREESTEEVGVPQASLDDLPRSDSDATSSQGQSRGKKPNRQQARLARRAAEQEAQIREAEKEAANMPDQRQQELTAMKQQMESRGLTETFIRPDGHCLYSACAHTIANDTAKDYQTVRVAAADFMKAHPDDFAPFMEEPIDSYTHKIKSTAEWGGHLELQAIAKAFMININVLQANGHVEKIQPESTTQTDIWLAYYKHSFGLGEHYNALKKAPAA